MVVPELLWHCSLDSEVFYFGSFTEFDVMSEECLEFWLVFPSIIWSLATLCDTLITFRKNHWLLKVIWRFSESVSEYESVFRICVWIIIHKKTSPSFLKFYFSRPVFVVSPTLIQMRGKKRSWGVLPTQKLLHINNKSSILVYSNHLLVKS